MQITIRQLGNALALSFPVNPSHTFEAGMIAELTLLGLDVTCGVSSGLAPLGIIDDTNTRAFTQPQIDEEIIFGPDLIGTPVSTPAGLVTAHDVMTTLQNPSIVKSSFVSNYPVVINYRNGVAKILTGSFLNYASIPGGTLDSVRIIVNYLYQVPDLPGDNTTLSTGRITVWFQRSIWLTDIFDTTQGYPLNCTLFCGLDGRLTSKQPTPNHPGIAICLGPPTAIDNMLMFMWV
jgi:hypothetical protein